MELINLLAGSNGETENRLMTWGLGWEEGEGEMYGEGDGKELLFLKKNFLPQDWDRDSCVYTLQPSLWTKLIGVIL